VPDARLTLWGAYLCTAVQLGVSTRYAMVIHLQDASLISAIASYQVHELDRRSACEQSVRGSHERTPPPDLPDLNEMFDFDSAIQTLEKFDL
jgi:hypothetical protein